jgi:hypothetical protein
MCITQINMLFCIYNATIMHFSVVYYHAISYEICYYHALRT